MVIKTVDLGITRETARKFLKNAFSKPLKTGQVVQRTGNSKKFSHPFAGGFLSFLNFFSTGGGPYHAGPPTLSVFDAVLYVFYLFPQLSVFFHFLFHVRNRVHDGRVIAIAEIFSNVVIGKV